MSIILQIKYASLYYSGRVIVSIRYCDIIIDRIQERKFDVPSVAAIRLFLSATFSIRIRSSIDKFYNWICTSRGLR